jgi:hypothetical protein
MVEKEWVAETSVDLNHLMRLSDRDNFTEFFPFVLCVYETLTWKTEMAKGNCEMKWGMEGVRMKWGVQDARINIC